MRVEWGTRATDKGDVNFDDINTATLAGGDSFFVHFCGWMDTKNGCLDWFTLYQSNDWHLI